MSLRQRLHLETEDGTVVEPTSDGRDLRAWEARSGKSAIGEPMSITMLTFLGWNAAKRAHLLNGEFDKFEAFDAVCVDVRGLPDEEAEAADPTPPAGSDTQTAASAG